MVFLYVCCIICFFDFAFECFTKQNWIMVVVSKLFNAESTGAQKWIKSLQTAKWRDCWLLVSLLLILLLVAYIYICVCNLFCKIRLIIIFYGISYDVYIVIWSNMFLFSFYLLYMISKINTNEISKNAEITPVIIITKNKTFK